jgi:hypothetical protein
MLQHLLQHKLQHDHFIGSLDSLQVIEDILVKPEIGQIQ